MKIVITNNVKGIFEDIDQIWLEIGIYDEDRNLVFVGIEFPKLHIQKCDFVEINDEAFDRAAKLQYRIKTVSGLHKVFTFSSKQKSILQEKEREEIIYGVKNKETPHNLFDKQKYFADLDSKIEQVSKLRDKTQGQKNLVYYSVYFKGPYLHLLNFSIETLLSYSKEDFDLLIITDEHTKDLINDLSFVKIKQPIFHLTETPFDGVEASINKIKVFDYQDIDLYKNILYLDCDTISIQNMTDLFKEKLRSNILYTAHNDHISYSSFKTIQHGFECLSEEFVKQMENAKQMPFNAGQFLFQNSIKMREHFNNIRWMIDNWVGKYFFEQCFMNYYFCKAKIADTSILQKNVNFILTTDFAKSDIKPQSKLIHFIAPALDGYSKLKFLYNYL